MGLMLENELSVDVNTHGLAQYAVIYLENGLVPIVEPEILWTSIPAQHQEIRGDGPSGMLQGAKPIRLICLLSPSHYNKSHPNQHIASFQSGPLTENQTIQHIIQSVPASRSPEEGQVSSTKGEKDPPTVQQCCHSRSNLKFKQRQVMSQDCFGRERLKRHREEVAGRVMIPDSWGQDIFLKDWIEYSTFDALWEPKRLSLAREALMAEGLQAASQRLRVGSRC
ncbi:hypothetical protein SAY87_006266 [Trapa incisa]|uniref:fructose-bisphosphate aldolase n=1 Tax=Trapa incisa TaxID=236973 RepID=A0AAN7PYT7_9MYRT|nr:hypothetical protein SAY87_006266 [Trapa incisa]